MEINSTRRQLSPQEELVGKRYREAVRELTGQLSGQQVTWRTVGYFRGASFLALLASLMGGLSDALAWGKAWWWLAGLAGLVFVAVAGYHETLANQIRLMRLRLRMNQHALTRWARTLREINEAIVGAPPEFLAIAKDLDLFGEHSLYRLIGTVRTPMAIEKMRRWLVEGAAVSEINERQQAIVRLRSNAQWLEQFWLDCERLLTNQQGPTQFVDWCQTDSWFASRRTILWISRFAIFVSLGCGLGLLMGVLGVTIAAPIIIAGGLANFFLSVFWAGAVHEQFNRISSRHQETVCYQRLFQAIGKANVNCPLLDRLSDGIFATGENERALKSLGLWVWMANIRRNGILFPLYLFFQLFFFWDLQVLDRLETWKSRYGRHAGNWFDHLGEWELLAALARFANDHPEWAFPKVVPKRKGHQEFKAEGMGHPLLPQDRRVDNDVQMGPDGTFLLVTGSNMSGKSTLLRSIGLNLALAQLGSVVCAKSLTMPNVRIDTSMRVADSLAEGVSFFMAELQRLKAVVDHSKKQDQDPERGHLFLLDEILQGTNSRERQIAVAQVVRRLVDQGSLGAISTHDLELAQVDYLAKICQTVHFTESFVTLEGTEQMTFDYRMRPGVAPTTNALKLLKLVGLAQD